MPQIFLSSQERGFGLGLGVAEVQEFGFDLFGSCGGVLYGRGEILLCLGERIKLRGGLCRGGGTVCRAAWATGTARSTESARSPTETSGTTKTPSAKSAAATEASATKTAAAECIAADAGSVLGVDYFLKQRLNHFPIVIADLGLLFGVGRLVDSAKASGPAEASGTVPPPGTSSPAKSAVLASTAETSPSRSGPTETTTAETASAEAASAGASPTEAAAVKSSAPPPKPAGPPPPKPGWAAPPAPPAGACAGAGAGKLGAACWARIAKGETIAAVKMPTSHSRESCRVKRRDMEIPFYSAAG